MSDIFQPKARVKVSRKFQVVIPKQIREHLGIKVGEELQVFVSEGSVHLRRPRTIKDLFGIAKGISWKDDYRDRRDRY